MIRIPRSFRVALAGSAAVATIAAGATALLAPSAGAAAGDAVALSIVPVYPANNQASAGTCMIYRAVPTTFSGAPASDSGTVVITLKENPNSPDQDLDFCLPPTAPDGQTGAVVDHGYYRNSTNGAPPSPAGPQYYCAGESITPGNAGTPNCPKPPKAASGTADNPDTSSNDSITTNPFVGANTNPAGTDYVDDVHYNNDPQTPNQRFIQFGVVGGISGSATIDACIDRSSSGAGNSSCADSGDINATQVPVTFTPGGKPDSVEAYNAVTNVTTDRNAYTAVQSPFTPASIDLTLLNNKSDTVFGVSPNFRVQSGPNAGSAIRSCSRSSDFGRSNCSYAGSFVGTDTLLFWVNHSAAPNSTATAGPDPGEPTATVTVTTYAQPAPAASARAVDLQPKSPSTTAGQSRVFTAVVTDPSAAPVQGAQVTFNESGPGQISGGQSPNGTTSSLTVFTGPDGRASVTITTQPGESGTETITASIDPNTTQCATLFNGQGGTCSDSTSNRIGGGPSPTPTPSTSATPSRSASPSASATASTSVSPSTSSAPARQELTIRTSTPDIQPNQAGVLDITGQPNASVELRCYTRPNTDYFTARGPVNLTSSGATQFGITPGANTRCYVRYTGEDATASPSVVINVHTTLSLSTVRNGARTYTFQGRNLPRRSGQLITLYRVDNNGNEIRTSNLTTDSSGIYRVVRKFTGTGTFRFLVRTSQTLNNAAGVSNIITVNVR